MVEGFQHFSEESQHFIEGFQHFSETGIVDKASKPLNYGIVGGYKSFCGSSGIVI